MHFNIHTTSAFVTSSLLTNAVILLVLFGLLSLHVALSHCIDITCISESADALATEELDSEACILEPALVVDDIVSDAIPALVALVAGLIAAGAMYNVIMCAGSLEILVIVLANLLFFAPVSGLDKACRPMLLSCIFTRQTVQYASNGDPFTSATQSARSGNAR